MNSPETKVQHSRQWIWVVAAIVIALAALAIRYFGVRAYRQQQLINLLRDRHYLISTRTVLPSGWELYCRKWLNREQQDLGSSSFDIWFNGNCSDEDLKLVKELFDLTYWDPAQALLAFDLSNSDVTDAALRHISHFQGMRNLDLSETAITDAGLIHLKDLTNLEHLKLCETLVTGSGFSHLGRMQQLEDLDLTASAVTDEGLLQISNLKSLRFLTLNLTEITGAGLQGLKPLRKLRELQLRGIETLEDEELAKLSLPPNLDDLNLMGSSVSEKGLEFLRELENLCYLNLAQTEISDDCIDRVKHFKHLRYLFIYNTQISPAAAQQLRTAMPQTRISY